VIIEKLNPEPDSDAEDSAVLDGIEGQLTNTQEKFYFGLAVSFLDQRAALPVLAPDREQLLEYDITRAITRVASLTKPVVGIMSGLPVLGRPLNPMTKQQPTEPWALATELQNMFTVKKVDLKADKIPDDIKVLLVIHPRDISETTEYALDQFILRGGKMIAFLDSYAYFDQQPDLQNPFGGNNAGQSTFYHLLKKWGYGMEMGKVVADLTYASGAGPRILPTLLSLNGDALNKEDVVASQVGTLLLPFASTFTGKPAEGLTQTVLVQSSPNAMLADLIIATLSGEPSTRGFQPAGSPYPLAIRVTGKFKTAFPEGKPKPYEPPSKDPKKAEAKADEPKGETQLTEAAQENSVGARVRRRHADRWRRRRDPGSVRPAPRGAAQRQPEPRAKPGRAGRGRLRPHQIAQPRRIYTPADGDPENGSARAAKLSRQDQGARGQPAADAGKTRRAAKDARRRAGGDDVARAAGRSGELQEKGNRDAPRSERAAQESARRKRVAAILDQGL
jgi:ABC-type uncharacterized transport system involved in gliding motility auxiliary subunit